MKEHHHSYHNKGGGTGGEGGERKKEIVIPRIDLSVMKKVSGGGGGSLRTRVMSHASLWGALWMSSHAKSSGAETLFGYIYIYTHCNIASCNSIGQLDCLLHDVRSCHEFRVMRRW